MEYKFIKMDNKFFENLGAAIPTDEYSRYWHRSPIEKMEYVLSPSRETYELSLSDALEANRKFLRFMGEFDTHTYTKIKTIKIIGLLCWMLEYIHNNYFYFPHKISLSKNAENECQGGCVVGKFISDHKIKIIGLEILGFQCKLHKHEITNEFEGQVPKNILYEGGQTPIIFKYIELDDVKKPNEPIAESSHPSTLLVI